MNKKNQNKCKLLSALIHFKKRRTVDNNNSSPIAIMQSLIHHKAIFRFPSHTPLSNYYLPHISKNNDFLTIRSKIGFRTLTKCSAASLQPIRYNGWDDFQLDSGEVNQFRNLLSSSGIGDKKYVFVYLFGFICALAISRVKVSWIMVFPACAVVFAVGFLAGLVKGGHLKGLKLNGNRKKISDESLRGCIEELKRNDERVLEMKNGIGRCIERNQVSLSDLEGYVDVIGSVSVSLRNATNFVESCVQSVVGGKQDKDGGFHDDSGRKRKKSGENGLNFSQYFDGVFGAKFDDPKSGKIEGVGKMDSVDAEVTEKLENVLASPAEERNPNSSLNGNSDPFDSSSRARDSVGYYVDESGMEYMSFGNEKKNFVEMNDTAKSVFDQTIYSYQNKTSRFVSNQQIHMKDCEDETETMSSHNSLYDSVDVSINMNRVKTSATSGRQKKSKTTNRNYLHPENMEKDILDSHRYPFENVAFEPEKEPNFPNQESSYENTFGSSPSSSCNDDSKFNRYLVEANDLLKEAKRCLAQQVDDGRAEHALHKSATLLSEAIEMRPMSLLAVGQLGNTYLLHGELKLRTTRYLRSLIVKPDQLANKDKIRSSLVVACEECEELLIKAGRKYRLAMSIDGNDMRALYNWGLALTFRAQLIADIGPSAARDADNVFLAAIDKFDAMMSKSNVYAPDALFRWGAALQHRAQLRPSRSREKVKLLQQARQLYEDALQMDSRNPRLRQALSSCASELDYWYT
ncbi:hypothetical protein SASPL_146446 [Salvia splendens]|uniref:Uncharacterized protein n=1 Tax=Salvia splendens TaxID=180675 RepID=A0A8X8Z5K7_SALSN|nr:uncharacterized protein LOC121775992 [Salvia splendens]XP_042029047.1 uncharacterized protein LOC121775992 [Salvia splendens]KAG6392233.1 hypothetical protein SASPL_146446 [Salvia splendens]